MGGNEAQPRLSATVHWSTHMPQHAALLDCRGEIAGRLPSIPLQHISGDSFSPKAALARGNSEAL